MAALLVVAAGLLSYLSARTEILFADGLRYVRQARALDAGHLDAGLVRAVDHPVYPTSIALAHRAVGGDSPAAWQAAAQAASILAGIALVIPLYLVAVELFGASGAWLGVLLVYLSPVPLRVMADALSESTFLLFWTWGLWAALRFLRQGAFGWLLLMISCAGLAYLTRPEGLLLPAALALTLLLMPLLRATRMNWPRWTAAVALLVVGPILVAGPYLVMKGGLGTKPAVGRILGTTSSSAALAVERARPLDASQGLAETYAESAKEALGAVADGPTLLLLPFALVGLARLGDPGSRPRLALFLSILGLAGLLGLIRLHATGGYCTPRHALVLSIPLILAAGAGIERLLSSVRIPERWLGLGTGHVRPGPALWLLSLVAVLALNGPRLLAPLNHHVGGYRDAGAWLAQHAAGDPAPVVDVTGWSLFYAGRDSGYTFANLIEAPGDPSVRYVVAREAHLAGPWEYCRQLKELTSGLEPVAAFPAERTPGQARVLVYDRRSSRLAAGTNPSPTTR
jgi:hypothetical protein